MSFLNRKDIKHYDKGGAVFHVGAYGAKANAQTLTGDISSGTTFTATVGTPFKPSDVGKVIYINGAGSGGAQLKTTISAYTSSTVVTLSASGTNNSGYVGYFGTDNTTAFQNAINAANAVGGGTVMMEAGIYIITSISMKRGVTLTGSSMDGSVLWSAINTGEVVKSFFPINGSNAAYVTVENLEIRCIDPINRATCLADVCGTYVRFRRVKVTGGIFGIVLDQSELSEVDECTIQTEGALYYGGVFGDFDPANMGALGWTKTGSGTTSTDGVYWTIDTGTSDGATYYHRATDGAQMFNRGFTVIMNPPIITASNGAALPNNSVIVRLDNGTYRYDLTFATNGVKLNGGTTRTTSAPASFIKLEVAVGGATANLYIDNVKVETNTAGASSASSAGIYFGDLATTDDSSSSWKYLEYYSCTPIPVGVWLVNGDFFWQSREQIVYPSVGNINVSTDANRLTLSGVSNARFTARDVGKTITINGAGAGSSNLTTTISAYISASAVDLTDGASTTVTNATVTYNPSSVADFTNRISINKCQFNTAAIQLALDGGNVWSFRDNNFNGGWKQIYIAGGTIAKIDTGEFEGSAGHTIIARGLMVQDYKDSFASCGNVNLSDLLLSKPVYNNYPLDVQTCTSLNLENVYFPSGSGTAIRLDRSGGVANVSLVGNTTGGSSLLGTYANVEGQSLKPCFTQINMSSVTSGSNSTGHFNNFQFPGSASTTSSYGIISQSTWAGSGASASGLNYGILGVGVVNASVTLGSNYGQKILSYNANTGTVTNNYGLRLEVGTSGGGTNTSNYGLSIKTYATSSSTLTSNYGIYVENPTKTSSTITTNYGLYLDSQSNGSTNYAIYSNGGQSFHSGNLGLGIAPSTQKLLVLSASTSTYAASFQTAASSATTAINTEWKNSSGTQVAYIRDDGGSAFTSIGLGNNPLSGALIFSDAVTASATYGIYVNGGKQYFSDKVGIGQTDATAVLHLKGGTATANTAPIKLTSGTALTTPEDGAIEYHSSHLYFTIGSTRYQIDQQSGGSGTVTNTGGNLTANSVVLGAGTADTKVVAGITTDGTSALNLGVAGSSVGKIIFSNATSGTITLQPVTGALGTITLSLPATTDTLIGRTTTDTLTNKTLTSPTIAKIANLTSNGFVKTSGGDGTLSVDTTTYYKSGDTPAFGQYGSITANSDTQSSQWRFLDTSTNAGSRNWAIMAGVVGYGDLHFRHSDAQGGDATTGTSAVVITRDNLIGVGGINSPNACLEVANVPPGGGTEILRLRNSPTSNWYGVSFNANNSGITNLYTNYGGTGTELPLVFGTFTYKTDQLYLGTNGFVGLSTAPSAKLHIAGNATANSWTTNGIQSRYDAATYTNANSSGTVSAITVNAWAQPTLAASSSTTYTNAANLYIADAPTAGTNVTITNAYSLYVAAGNSYFGGRIGVGITPTAKLHLPAGTTSANTAPLKLTTGTAMTTPEDGAIEYHSSHLYFTIGSTRYQLDQQGVTVGATSIASGTNGKVLYNNSGTLGEYSVTGTAGEVVLSTSPTITGLLTSSGRTITTDANNTVASGLFNSTFIFPSSNTNTITYPVLKINPTIQSAGSVTNKTIDVLQLDTVIIDLTGTTVRLINAMHGSVTKFSVDSAGAVVASAGVTCDTLTANTSLTTALATFGGGTLLTVDGTSITGGAGLTIKSTTSSVITLDSGTTGAVNIGTGANAKTVTIGSTTSSSTLNLRGNGGNVNVTSGNLVVQSAAFLKLNNSGNTYAVSLSGSAVSAAYDLVLPSTQGAAGTKPLNDGSGNLSWSTGKSVNSISSPTTAGSTAGVDYYYLVSGTTTLTMPSAASNINLYIVKNTGTATVTIARAGSDTIESDTSVILNPNESVTLVSDGTSAWWIVN